MNIKDKTYIIAEMSANHGGDYEKAIEIIRKAKWTGADCIKIQTYTADTMTIDCDNEYFNINEGLWKGENLYTLYKSAYTPWEWQKGLKKEADRIGIDFLSTPFDNSAVDFLEKLGVSMYKIASFEIGDLQLVKYVASKKKPIIMSAGMASFKEIKEAVEIIKKEGIEDLIVLKCSSAYPAILEDMNLKTMLDIKSKLGVEVGLSDHSLGSEAAIIAVSMGAKVIEKHFCLNREIKTADSEFSMEPQEFKEMVDRIRRTEEIIGKVDYSLSEREKKSKKFRRSIFVVEDINKGGLFTKNNIRVIRPGNGMKPKYYEKILGSKAIIDIKRGTPLKKEMVE